MSQIHWTRRVGHNVFRMARGYVMNTLSRRLNRFFSIFHFAIGITAHVVRWRLSGVLPSENAHTKMQAGARKHTHTHKHTHIYAYIHTDTNLEHFSPSMRTFTRAWSDCLRCHSDSVLVVLIYTSI